MRRQKNGRERRFFTDENPILWLRCALLVVAVFGIVRGIRYGIGREQLPMAVQVATRYVPVEVWGIAWGIAALIAILCVPKAYPGGSFPVICLCFGFAVGYTVSWLTSGYNGDPLSHADYVGASNYWTVGLLLICGYFGFMRALKKPGPPEDKP